MARKIKPRAYNESALAQVPAEMKDLPVWLKWRWGDLKPNGKHAKIPYYANGKRRFGVLDALEDRSRLVTFDDIVASFDRSAGDAGLGIALGPLDDGRVFSGIDLDGCVTDGQLSDHARQIIDAGGYAEYSPYGKGVHILGFDSIGTQAADGRGVEIYSGKHFFTVTGNAVNRRPLKSNKKAAELARRLYEIDRTEDARPKTRTGALDYGDLRAAIAWMPNRLDYSQWVKVGLALRWELGESGRSIWMEHSAKWKNFSERDAAEKWNSFQSARGEVTGLTVLKLVREAGWKPGTRSYGSFAEPRVFTYGAEFDPKKIPPRQWVIEGILALGEVTGIGGPPGVNKSLKLLNDAVEIVTGEVTLSEKPPARTGHVLMLVGEDGRRDLEARLAAICAYYDIKPSKLADRLHVVYLTEEDNAENITLARMNYQLAELNREMFDWIRAFPDLVAVVIDPIVAWHRLIENDNTVLGVLCKELRRTAVAANVAVALDHHVTKASMGDPEAHVGNMAAWRGGGVFIGDIRWAFTMAKLNATTANEYGVEPAERDRYRRFDALKASYGPTGGEPVLFKLETIQIQNGEGVVVMETVNREERLQQAAEERQRKADQHEANTGDALARMLKEKSPRSLGDAARWILAHEPRLFAGPKGAAPVERTISRQLQSVLSGEGVLADTGRIVLRSSGEGRAMRHEIAFAHDTHDKKG